MKLFENCFIFLNTSCPLGPIQAIIANYFMCNYVFAYYVLCCEVALLSLDLESSIPSPPPSNK